MVRRRLRQRGASFGGVMVVIMVVVFFGTLVVTMAPSYMTFSQVRSIMNGLQDKPEIIAGGSRKIMSSLSSQLYINDVRSLPKDAFDIEKTKDGLLLSTDYEVRKHVFFNVDVIMHFAHEVTLNKQ